MNYNRVNIVAMADGIVAETGALRGRRRVSQMIDFVEQAPTHRRIALRRGVQAIRPGQPPEGRLRRARRDFFDKDGYENGLRYVAGGKYDLFCVQCLSPQEIEPDLQGDLKLRDIEDDDMAEVSITQPLIKQYKANLNAYCLSLKDYVTRRGGTYLFTQHGGAV